MNTNYLENNHLVLVGKVTSDKRFSHEIYGEKFYIFDLAVPRLSGNADIIPITVSERLLSINDLAIDSKITVEGQFRSYNSYENEKNRLVLTVFAKDIKFIEDQSEEIEVSKDLVSNEVILNGYICKKPIYRQTPFGREISDLLLAVNRAYNKSDYIPCIAWGRNARFCENIPVGTYTITETGVPSGLYNQPESRTVNVTVKDNETEERQNLLKSFDYYDYENDTPAKRETPEYKDIKIAFKVTEPQTSDRILINEAQISEQTDGKGIHREDRDSHPNEWLGEDDEDIEKVRVLYFDLALRKWVTKAIVTQDGKETVFETGHHAEDDPEDVVKVDLKKSKINKVVVKFEYQIRITNEGEIDGYAKEIKDRIPEGLRFDPADNPTWTQLEENIIVTDELKDTLLKPGESAEVTVVLTWINSGDNLGLKVNVAEISKDYNDYGTHDIDSTPDNNVWGEDDIDDAPVMLAVKTGNAVFGYIAIAVFVAGVIVIGVRRIKKINEG